MSTTEFLSIQKLAGELLISQTRNGSRCLLTTKELIFQKPHVTYYILLQDIVGMIPYRIRENPTTASRNYYQIATQEFSVIRPSGLLVQQAANIMLPISQRILQFLTQQLDLIKVS